MQKNLSNKELVAAGHKFAANISADTPLIDMAKMVSELATQLDVALAAAAEAGKQRDQLALESVGLKDAVALLLEDARRVQQLEPNAGTETRINTVLSLLTRAGNAGKDGV